jgi:hypothetical protein
MAEHPLADDTPEPKEPKELTPTEALNLITQIGVRQLKLAEEIDRKLQLLVIVLVYIPAGLVVLSVCGWIFDSVLNWSMYR